MAKILISLIIISTLSIVLSNCSVEIVDNRNNLEEPREDYGCVHDNNSQYDDGDSLNLEAASQNL